LGLSAQRLSASRSFAEIPRFREHQYPHVLNAFRHHGVSRVLIRVCLPVIEDVLNAFRHHGVSRYGQAISFVVATACAQRLSASRSFAVTQHPDLPNRVEECSTPFGITEFRGGHFRTPLLAASTCSTPFGITEFRGLLS